MRKAEATPPHSPGKRRLRRAAAVALLAAVAAVAPRLRADVGDQPLWRLATGITTALADTDTIYVGGTFTSLYTPSTTQEQFYDLVTGQLKPECAKSTDPQRALSGYTDGAGGILVPTQFGDAFEDDAGAFVPDADTTLVRIMDTCRWDRQFQAGPIDPFDAFNLSIGVPARAGNRVLGSNAVLDPTTLKLRAQVASFDAGTGQRVNFQFYTGTSEIGILGASAARVIVRVKGQNSNDPYMLGAIDPVTLQLTTSSTVLLDETAVPRAWVRGNVLYRFRPAPSNRLEAYDLTTLAPVSGWAAPFVPGLIDVEVAGGRVFVTARVINGQTAPSPAALVAASGAIDASWNPPALTRKIPDPSGTPYQPVLTALSTDGVRLYFSGDFERVGGVDRDGVAALAVAGGTLSSWDSAPWLVEPLEITTTALLATRPVGSNRVTRRYLAAVDRATGLATAWDPNDPATVLQHQPSPVAALAADAANVYFASATTGEILRADRTSAVVDTTWRLVVRKSSGDPGVIRTMSVSGGYLYLGGEFDAISGTNFAPAARQSLAAVGLDGALGPWAPTLQGSTTGTLLRTMLVDGGIVYLGGDFSAVNNQFRLGFAGVDAISGTLALPEMFVQGDTSIYGMATDGVQLFVAGASFGAPLVGTVSLPDATLTQFSTGFGLPPTSAALVAGRFYAGAEYDIDTGQPTARPTQWGTVTGDSQGLVHILDDGTIDYYEALPGNPPGAPVLTASSSGNTVSIAWTPSATGGAASSYTLYAGSAPGARDLAALTIRGTSFTANAPTGLYYLTVVGRNAFGPGPPSNEVAVQAGCVTAPPPPGALTFQKAGATVRFAWGASATAVSYAIEAGQTPGTAGYGVAPLGNVTSLTATAPLGLYYVRLRAANACGVSGPSNEVAVLLDGSTPLPSAPTAFTAVTSGRDVAFSWQPPAVGGLPSGYRIEAGLAPGAVMVSVPTVVPGLFVPNAPPGSYYVRVRAVNAAGDGPVSNEVHLVVP
ncbi:MAG: fibronectin type III domain-containing protein [Vicinamibacterales bacterium]